MDLSTLGYTDKWIEFKFLSKEVFQQQLAEFEKEKDESTEHFRHRIFKDWLKSKKKLTNTDIEQFITLAEEDENDLMAGCHRMHNSFN